jgi:enamine deaminase RidA (YjgF/YER057c/UK114 family)
VALDSDRKIVGENDIVVQTRKTMLNLKAAVETGSDQIFDIVQNHNSRGQLRPFTTE